MRQLHPVSFNEKFVASGKYLLDKGNLPTGDVEYWTIHEPGEGSFTIRSDYDGREGTGRNWIFEGLVVDSRIDRFDMELFGTYTSAAKFMFDDSEVEISQRVNGQAREPMTVMIPVGYSLSPPPLAARWLFVPSAVGKVAQVWTPDLDSARGIILGGHSTAWQIEDVGETTHPIGEQHIACRKYRLSGDGGELNACLDAYGVLMRLDSDSGERALLTEYVRRPDVKS